MPFKSKAQQGYLFAKKPEVAMKFAEHTKDYKSLPSHVKMKDMMKKKKKRS